MQVRPSIWGTLTFQKPTRRHNEILDRICKNTAKRFGIHLVVEVHVGIQLERYKKHGVKSPDLHFVLGSIEPIKNLSQVRKYLKSQSIRYGCGWFCKFDEYDTSKNDVWYSFCGHDEYRKVIYCPHKSACRRKRRCKTTGLMINQGCPVKRNHDNIMLCRT